jgi:hypothetical protein
MGYIKTVILPAVDDLQVLHHGMRRGRGCDWLVREHRRGSCMSARDGDALPLAAGKRVGALWASSAIPTLRQA